MATGDSTRPIPIGALAEIRKRLFSGRGSVCNTSNFDASTGETESQTAYSHAHPIQQLSIPGPDELLAIKLILMSLELAANDNLSLPIAVHTIKKSAISERSAISQRSSSAHKIRTKRVPNDQVKMAKPRGEIGVDWDVFTEEIRGTLFKMDADEHGNP